MKQKELNQDFIINRVIVKGSATNTATAQVKTQIKKSADLSVVKTANRNRVLIGDKIIFFVTITNNGPSDATGVELIDILPNKKYTIESIEVSKGKPPIIYQGYIICRLGNLDCGESALVTISIIPKEVGIYTNKVFVWGNEHDPKLFNNYSSKSVEVYPMPCRGISFIR